MFDQLPTLSAEIVGWATLVLGVAGAWLTVNAFRPLRHPLFMFQSFFAAWIVSELSLHHLVLQLTVIGLAIVMEAHATEQGLAGIVLLTGSSIGAVRLYDVARRSVRVLPKREGQELPAYPRLHLIAPALAFLRRDVSIVRGIEFTRAGDRGLHVDVFQPRTPGKRRPAIVQIHGGAWVVGFKWAQGIPLLGHLCAQGWVAFNVDYRLSPRAAFPDHLIDVKRAIAWIREHADEYGVDPDFIVVTGGSAGGHLAAMVALTAGDPAYQPGFEHADTSVAACIPLYGVYDLVDAKGVMAKGFRLMLERVVFKVRFSENPHPFERASPIYRIHPDIPPFFVVHGTADNIIPVEQARNFVAALRQQSPHETIYVELQGAGHAFDVFPSIRTLSVVEAITAYLIELHRGHAKDAPVERKETAAVEAAKEELDRGAAAVPG